MRVISALVILLGGTIPALAGDGVHVVIPGRPGVPIIINGIDASYAVVEGDWGLAHGVHVQPTVYGGRLIDPVPNVGHYYPSAGRTPGYGRLEIEPPKNRKLPKPAESFPRILVGAIGATGSSKCDTAGAAFGHRSATVRHSQPAAARRSEPPQRSQLARQPRKAPRRA